MGASVTLGRVFGVPVRLHFSWFIIFFLFTILFEGHFDQQRYQSWSTEERWLVALATTLLLLLSVLAHELCHSLVAMRRGIPVHGITLFIFGGVSQISREPQRPFTEFIVAVVGPLSSILMGLLFLGLALALKGVSQQLSDVAWMLGYVNIALVGIFNMLPCFPMDGGRVLRAAAWWITGDYWRATKLATMGGQVLAFTIILAGITLTILASLHLFLGLWLVVVGMFLLAITSASHRQYRMSETLTSFTARDLMANDCPVAPGDVTLSQLMDEYMRPSGCEFTVLTALHQKSWLNQKSGANLICS